MSLLLLFTGTEIATQSLTLESSSLSPGVGETVTLTATLLDRDGLPLEGKTIYFTVSGANSADGTDLTDVDGEATFDYTPSNVGVDTAFAQWGDADGLDLVISHPGNDTIYRLDGFSGSVLTQFAVAPDVVGIAFDGDNLITATQTQILKRSGISSTTTSTIAAPGTLTAVTWAAGNLVTASISTVYIHDGFSTTILTSFPSPEGEVHGLGFDGENLLVAIITGAADFFRKVYRMVGISSVVDTSVSIAVPSSEILTSTAWDGENLLLGIDGGPAGDRVVRRYDGFSGTETDEVGTPDSGLGAVSGVEWTAALNDSLTLSIVLMGSGHIGRRTARLVP